MRIQRNWSSSVTIKVQPNYTDVTLLPGNVVDVPQNQYQSLKDIYGTSFAEVGNDSQIQMVVKSFTNAQIKTLYSAPIQLVAAPGAWYAIDVLEVSVSLTYASAAFATNTDLYVVYDSATAGDGGGANTLSNPIDTILKSTANQIAVIRPLVDEQNLTQNKGITAYVGTGNPATGWGTMKMRVYYRILSLS